MKRHLAVLALAVFFSSQSFAKEIAFSFDDVPRDPTALVSNREELLRKNLAAEKIQAVFFCNPGRFDEAGRARARRYAGAGHLLANHSQTHPSLNKIEAAAFWEDVMKADAALRDEPQFRKWFRFPFLHEGNTPEKRDFVRQKMKESGYQAGYVTIDTEDWYMDSVVQQKLAKGFRVDQKQLGKAYAQMIVEGAEFYEKLSREILGRSAKHVLLLHENDLAALFVGDLAKEFRRQGWKIISPDEAYKDPIASVAPDTMLLNQGRVAALARVKNPKVSVWPQVEEESVIEGRFEKMKVFLNGK